MLLYKITFKTKSNGEIHVSNPKWVGSKSEASKERAWIRSRDHYVPASVETEQIDVPTNKKGLLGFLNRQYQKTDD